MSKYILLRDNKENGPFTLDQLISKGFKAYDLIWIEGKSAGWRYPSEIDELKAYAPIIEEQPFDRFYKKSAGQTQTVPSGSATSESVETIVINQTPVSNNYQPTNISPEIKQQPIPSNGQPATSIQPTTKRIYVTIPANQVKLVATNPAQMNNTDEKKPVIEEKPNSSFNKQPVLEEKFSQPLDDIKKMYVDSLVKQNNKKLNAFVIPEKIKIAAAAMLLLLAGTITGLLINSHKPSTEKGVAATIPEQKVINTAATEQPSIIEIPNSTTSESTNEIEPNHKIPVSAIKTATVNEEKPGEESIAINIKPIAENRKTVKRETEINKQQARPTGSSGRTDNTSNQDMQAGSNEQPITTSDKLQTVNKVNLAKDINITASNYKRATFGGISDLEFTVTNNSSYLIDMVAAEVEYYTANNKLYKKETIYFNNVAPNGSQVKKAPDSNRGYTVKYRISLISSKQLGLYTANL